MTGSNQFSNTFSLTDEIADIIRDRILKGEYKIGEKIKENQIATELRVSRTPIREAFKQLENEGLIDYIPNRGCFAKGFTKQDIEDIYAVRKALEVLSVEWAVNRITPEEISNLQDQSDLMEFYTTRKDGRKVLEINTDFTISSIMPREVVLWRRYCAPIKNTSNRPGKYYSMRASIWRKSLQSIKRFSTRSRNGMLSKPKEAMARHLDGSKRRAQVVYKIKD